MSRRAKIVCTLGPATSDPGTITDLVAAGLDVARLNMSHGDHDAHRAAYQAVPAAGAWGCWSTCRAPRSGWAGSRPGR